MNKIYINGKWKESQSGDFLIVEDPSTGEEIAKVASCSKEDVTEAIETSSTAFQEWKNTTGEERYELLMKVYQTVIENKEELAEVLSKENGKPFKDAVGEVLFGASYLRWYAEEAKRLYGELIPSFNKGKRISVIKQPVGVVAVITPWNYPFAMMARKFATALAAGCTVVVKPAESTPLTAVKFFEYVDRAEVPKGVANLVVGNPQQIGEVLLNHRKVAKVTFTGSTQVGKLLMKQAADQVKKISLELGGHAPFIVFEDADLDEAIEGAMIAKFKNNGQACVCGNRFYVHESIIDTFLEKFVAKAKSLNVGSWNDDKSDVGPLINETSIEKIKDQLNDALEKGAQLRLGGNRISDIGYFYEPTVITNVNKNMKIYNEETFGPIAPFIPFSTEDEVVEMANDSLYGLAAYFYTNDTGRTIRVSESLEYGVVGINDAGPATAYQAPFGGFKESGIGREGGHHGIEEFMETKYISLGFKQHS